MLCCYANGLDTTWYTKDHSWRPLGSPMKGVLKLPKKSMVLIQYAAVGATSAAGAPVVLRVCVNGRPIEGGACGINGMPNQWQTLSHVCAVELRAGQHELTLECQAQVPGTTCYVKNATLMAIGGLAP